jgi:hypothetical protein
MKFRYASSAVLEQNRIDEIVSTIENLEDVTNIAQLVALLH